MKVAHVTPSYYPATSYGGPPASAHNLSVHLARAGADVRVLTTNADGKRAVIDVDTRAERTFEPGLRVRYAPRRLPESVAPALLRAIPELVAWCDVVHLNAVYNFTTLPTLAAAKASKKPVVWTARGALQRWEQVEKRNVKAAFEAVCRALAPKRTAIHVTSEEEKRESALRMPGFRVEIIPNGVDVPADIAPRRTPEGALRLVCLGRLHPIKGLENILRACAISASRGDPPLTLTLAGAGDAAYTESLRALVTELGLGPRVTLLGEVKGGERAALFADHDALVAPSFRENFGLSIVEALAHGLPVIAGRGTPWQRLEEERAGLWVPNDPESLAAAVERLRAMPMVEMGARGRAWMAREYGWARVAKDMLALYRDLLATPP